MSGLGTAELLGTTTVHPANRLLAVSHSPWGVLGNKGAGWRRGSGRLQVPLTRLFWGKAGCAGPNLVWLRSQMI